MRYVRRAFVLGIVSVLIAARAYADHASSPPPVGVESVPRVVDPKAAAIVDRGIAAAKQLQTLEVVSRLTLEGPDAAEHDQGTDTPARWTFDFHGAPAGAPFARAAIESLKDGRVTRRVTFDGTTARSVSDSDRTFMTGSLQQVGDQSTAMPGWFIDNRLGMAPVGGGPDDMALPPLVAAHVVGEQELDGVVCDIVTSVRARMTPEFVAPDGAKIPAREMRIVETVAYARTDGLARRASMAVELEGIPPDGVVGVATFSGVKVNPKLEDSMFDTSPPPGFTRKDPPTPRGERAERNKVPLGSEAPPFSLKDLGGREVTLASLRGRVVVLDFWATWCGPCKAAMPAMQKIHDDYAGKEVTVLGIDVWERKPEAGPAYFQSKGYSYGCLLEGEALAGAYGITGIPTLVIIDRSGKVAFIETGFGPDEDAALRAAIDAVLAK